ncbi:MAG: hypothetical protein ACI9KE_004986 [Polyangiales bacterium]|jgi:hypothetical protein
MSCRTVQATLAILLAGCGGNAPVESAQGPDNSSGAVSITLPVISENAGSTEGTEPEVRTESRYVVTVPMTTDPVVMQQAAAEFQRADAGFAQFARLSFQVGQPANLSAYIQSLGNQINQGSQQAQALFTAYEEVRGFQTAHWSVAALSQQGRVQETLAAAIRNTNVPFVLPAAVQQQLAGQAPNTATQTQLHAQVVSTVQQVLDARSQPIQCLALVRYVKAVRLARLASSGGPMINAPHSDFALARLRPVPDSTLAECIRSTQPNDPALSALVPGEFRL